MPSTEPETKPLIEVACGVLRRPEGRVLLTQRPAGKLAAGAWEFPGGKLEPGESPAEALRRELYEELRVEVLRARPLIRLRHDYSDRTVMLDTWLVEGFGNRLEGREGQSLAWLSLDEIAGYPVLPTVKPIVASLRLPEHYAFTPPEATEDRLKAGIEALPAQSLLRLRQPALSDSEYHLLACRILPWARARGLKLIVDRDPLQASRIGADGWHASEAALESLSVRPVESGMLFLASAHSAGALLLARTLGADAAVLGAVHDTPSHPGGVTLGWSGFAALAREQGIPVYAIGGVGPAERLLSFQHGAQGVAGIRGFWSG